MFLKNIDYIRQGAAVVFSGPKMGVLLGDLEVDAVTLSSDLDVEA